MPVLPNHKPHGIKTTGQYRSAYRRGRGALSREQGEKVINFPATWSYAEGFIHEEQELIVPRLRVLRGTKRPCQGAPGDHHVKHESQDHNSSQGKKGQKIEQFVHQHQ